MHLSRSNKAEWSQGHAEKVESERASEREAQPKQNRRAYPTETSRLLCAATTDGRSSWTPAIVSCRVPITVPHFTPSNPYNCLV